MGSTRAHRRRRVVARATVLAAVLAAGVTGAVAVVPGAVPGATAEQPAHLYLVTLRDPGLGATDHDFLARALDSLDLSERQDDVLARVDAPAPVYRWTAALNGVAVELTPGQVDGLRALPEVARVERDEVRALAGTPSSAATLAADAPRRGGRDVVVGLVDTGLAPDSPLFAQLGDTGRPPGFHGGCADGPEWSESDCNGKVVGARWFVDGFGADRLRATAVLSPRDTDGHGTQVASIAAGNADVPVRVGRERLGRFGGQAPDARIAVYKACWSAPDPDNDGCSTADLVSALDAATRDGVDVLSLPVGGPAEIDTLELALLGATESGVVVAAAAGDGRDPAAHPSPWVTTVGGTTGDARRGRVVLPGGTRLTGAMLSRRDVGPARAVLAARVPAASATRAEARACVPGSLDAARVADRIVVCERGQVGRVDKSEAVALADGVGMALINTGRGSVDADAHAVPTVHLDAADGRTLKRWVARHPRGRVSLTALGVVDRPARVARWSAAGLAGSAVLKPDVVAPASGVLGAVPGSGSSWGFVSGTSAATAHTAGVAARLLARPGVSAPEVRSLLVTAAERVRRSPVLESGAGRVEAASARRPGLGLIVTPSAYRRWLDGEQATLNTPTITVSRGQRVVRRVVTNLSARRLYYSSAAVGFRGDVSVTPAALRLGPGETAVFRVRVPRSARLDDGAVVWRGADGSTTRLPVVVAR